MDLIELFLPVTLDEGAGVAGTLHEQVRIELTARFGGVTAFTRAPAHGTFEDEGRVVHDEIAIYEVMTESLDRAWWTEYRTRLELLFHQDEILVRASTIERL